MDFEIFPIKALSKSESYKCNTIYIVNAKWKNHILCAYVKKQSKNYEITKFNSKAEGAYRKFTKTNKINLFYTNLYLVDR